MQLLLYRTIREIVECVYFAHISLLADCTIFMQYGIPNILRRYEMIIVLENYQMTHSQSFKDTSFEFKFVLAAKSLHHHLLIRAIRNLLWYAKNKVVNDM